MTLPVNVPLRRGIGAVLRPSACALVGVAAIPAAYLGVLTIAALGDGRRTASPNSAPHSTRFAVLVPAHDEASVIGATVSALIDQRYPADRFTVNLVADNCSDETAAVARASGARVFERDDLDNPGKGSALNWLLDQVGLDDIDAVVVVDADTVASAMMLGAFDQAIVEGAKVVQGDYGVLDPDSDPAVALRFAALACRHRLRPLGRTRLGASCGLYGNGMAFRAEVMHGRSWSGHLVEDAEFQLDLLLDGITVAYCPAAQVAAEMPATWDGAVSQHQRWELGRAQLLRRFAPALGRAVVTGRGRASNRLRRRASADALIDLAVPPLSLLVVLQIVSLGIAGAAHVVTPGSGTRRLVGISAFGVGVTVFHVGAALRIVRAPWSIVRALSSAPRLIAWKLGVLAGIVRRPDEVVWQRTIRNNGSGDEQIVAPPASVAHAAPARVVSGVMQ